MANAQTFQSAIAEQQVSAMGDLLALGALMCGVMFGIQALLAFKRHAEHPANAPISKGVFLMFMSVGLICLPQFMKGAAPSQEDQPRVVAAKPLKGEAPMERVAVEKVAPSDLATSPAPKPGLSAESFALAERAAAREIEAKGLPKAGLGAPSHAGAGAALAWALGSLAALGAAGGLWARRASKRIGREKEAQAMPRVNLNEGRGAADY